MQSVGSQDNAVMDEIWPGRLMSAWHAIPAAARSEFPMLERVTVRSPAYVDELQLLVGDEVPRLLAELRRLRQLCRREEFVRGVNGAQVFDRWRTWSEDGQQYESDDMNDYLDGIEELLERAAQYGWTVRLML